MSTAEMFPAFQVESTHRTSFFDGVPAHSDRLYVRGRCLAGPMHIGAAFDTICRAHGEASRDSASTNEKFVIVEGRIEVKAIRAYGRTIDYCPSGMSAELELLGVGSGLLQQGDVIGNLAIASEGM